MAERIWTEPQKQAIDLRKGDLIISAAAGSGKTAVLCERVIRSLLDEDSPINISDMLIVTFTKASAEELKGRIADAIRGAMESSPSNSRLIRQLIALQNADIGTIHSFCGNLITKYSSELSLPTGVRVSDATESDIIAHKVMERTIDEMCASFKDFHVLVDNFTYASDSELGETLLEIYKKTQNHPDSIKFIYDCAIELSQMNEEKWRESRFAKQISKAVLSEAEFYIKTLSDGIEYIKNDEKVYLARGESYEYDVKYLKSLCVGAELGWDALVLAFGQKYEPPKCKAVKGITDSRIEEIKDIRDETKKKILAMTAAYSTDYPTILDACRRNAEFLNMLYKTLSRFDEKFSQEKLRLSVIDFTDLEKMAYKLLVNADKTPTAIAREISKKYKQIYIDEYQDTNALQDGIFKAISCENRFMVGDIKQSIYGFRGAEPSIFASYRDSFETYEPEKADSSKNTPHRIFLSNNFRCDEPIIDFSNEIFGVLFRNSSGKIAYLDEDELKFSKGDRDVNEKVTVTLVKKDEDCANFGEAYYVAGEIKKLVALGAQLGEIAVLLRSFSENSKVFKRVFEREGIRFEGQGSIDVLESPEVLFLLSLLNAIDNPHRDIWFAGALSSKIFGIEFNDIVDIASEKYESKPSLYDKFRVFTEQNDFEKGKKMLAWLDASRETAASKRVIDIIEDICRDFGVSTLVLMGENDLRALDAFKNLARNYEKSAFRGLHSFVKYVDDIRARGTDADALKIESSDKKDGVSLLSMHHSKGLEFKYCFVSGCGKEVNKRDIYSKFLISTSFGAVIRPIDQSGYVRYNSPMYRALADHIYENQIDEEMRVLYVALTRAKSKLYVTSEAKDVDKVLEKAEKMRKERSPYTFRNASVYMLWILASTDFDRDDRELIKYEAPSYHVWKNSDGKSISTNEENVSESTGSDMSAELGLGEIKTRLEYVYPHTSELELPAKLAISKLFPDILDTDYTELIKDEKKFTDIPKFISANDDECTGAMRGTATHVFMQFCDFENAEKNGVEIELARLCDKKYIDANLARLVYIDKLKMFFASELYGEIKSAKNVWREKRFSIMLPASEFTGKEDLKKDLSDARLLVQGVFDCLIEKSDGTLKLIDYKTDSVSGVYETDAKMLRERYHTQLSYYTRACELMMNRTVSETSLYSFGLGKEVRII